VCIAGGFAIQGDLLAVGASTETTMEETVPLRPVVVRPFLLDTYEYTVGRLRAAVLSGSYTGSLPTANVAGSGADAAWCTWLGANDPANDRKPLNCIDPASAGQLCALAGRRLPTEVEWEFAARGRGQRRSFPWGEQGPACCTASFGRLGPPSIPIECGGAGLENVGSHPLSASCANTGDVSRDGAYDLGGSVSEIVSTFAASYADPCWQAPGILRTAPCTTGVLQGDRGSYWNAGAGTTYGALRHTATANAETGFRCAEDAQGT
jgi:formylglycine-generating enzyme required for sulfatase activity